MKWTNDHSQLQTWIETLNQFNATPGDGITRQLFTPEDMAARRYLISEMEKLGLQVHQDAIGNIYGVAEGTDPSLAPVWSGSHIDTVLHGGSFDGMCGVLCAMESVRIIREAGLSHRRSIVCCIFSGEEPARFGIGCVGSRALIGEMSTQEARERKDVNGVSLYDAMVEVGLDPEKLPTAKVQPGQVHAHIELHIEQNVHLERQGVPIGVVTSICAPSNLVVTVSGRSGHAGGMAMTERWDAFAAVAEMALEVERIGRTESTSDFTTATVGRVNVEPNQSNIVPGKVVFTVDVRDAAKASKDRIMEMIKAMIMDVAAKRGITAEIYVQNHDTPMPCAPFLQDIIEGHCQDQGVPCMKMVSGPFHDALHIGEFCPVGMIFIPSKAGLSHCPEEWTDYGDVCRGSRILASTLLDVANQ